MLNSAAIVTRILFYSIHDVFPELPFLNLETETTYTSGFFSFLGSVLLIVRVLPHGLVSCDR